VRKRREALNIYLQELMRRPAIAETDDFCKFLQLEKKGGVPGVLSAVAAAKGGCGALKVGYVMKQGHYFRQWKRRYDRRPYSPAHACADMAALWGSPRTAWLVSWHSCHSCCSA
jgi:hypothetical protein